ncbi:lysylphosphatidylglycerol synthase domain-containing protein [Shewanella atlantica]|uniref:lysylphosphatidylglycerol synthase domain-containing protein n=1 Tax=Shewanella atlantica TaxID=271099 RepID=UPI00373602C7
MNRLYRLTGIVLVVTATIYFLSYLVKNWELLPTEIFELQMVPTFIATTLCYLSCFLLTSKAWYRLLHYFGETPRFLPILSITLLSQFAKYLPGNFAHHIGRIMLASNEGISKRSIATTLIFELILVILAAGTSGLIAVAFTKSLLFSDFLGVPSPDQVSALSVVIVLIFLLFCLSLPSIKNTIIKSSKDNVFYIKPLYHLLVCYLYYITNFLLLGAILYLLTDAQFSQVKPDYWLLTGLFSIAWIVGFITPGAPAGLGVREAILIMALDPIYGSAVALSLTITLRIITTLGDGLGFLIGLSMRRCLKYDSKA